MAEGEGFEPPVEDAQYLDGQFVYRNIRSQNPQIAPQTSVPDCPILSELLAVWDDLHVKRRKAILTLASTNL